jgi:hypothetical protein
MHITYNHKPENDRVAEAQFLGAFAELRKAFVEISTYTAPFLKGTV